MGNRARSARYTASLFPSASFWHLPRQRKDTMRAYDKNSRPSYCGKQRSLNGASRGRVKGELTLQKFQVPSFKLNKVQSLKPNVQRRKSRVWCPESRVWSPRKSKGKGQKSKIETSPQLARGSRSVLSQGHRDCPPSECQVPGTPRHSEPRPATATASSAGRLTHHASRTMLDAHTTCYLRSTTGSPKGLTRKICARPEICWRS